MSKVKVRVYICGQIEDKAAKESDFSAINGWEEFRITKEEKAKADNIYYSSFVNSMLNSQDGEELAKEYANKKQLTFSRKDNLEYKGLSFTVSSRDVYFMPDGLNMWSVQLDYEADASRVSGFHEELRRFKICDEIFAPIGRGRCGKFAKIFQYILADTISDEALYEFGTLTPAGSVTSNNTWKPDPIYFQKILQENRLGVFENWTALMLVDTVTFLCKRELEGLNFQEDIAGYFRLCYLNCLYRKYSLFRLNRAFHSKESDRINELFEQTVRNEQWYAFVQISYKFQPQLIYESMQRALEISDEQQQLHTFVRNAAEHRQRKSEKYLSWILAALTILSIFSLPTDIQNIAKIFSQSFYWAFLECLGLVGILICVLYLILRNK